MSRVIFFLGIAGLLVAPLSAAGWGNFGTHPEITDSAQARAEGLDQNFRDFYGLHDGIFERLGVQTGFDEEIDRGDLLLGPMPSKYERSQNGVNLLGFTKGFAPPPEDVGIRVNRCESGCSPESLERFSIDHLLRAGVFAEDEPNLRASHHFHDPEKAHNNPSGGSVPPENRGLDNTDPSWLLGNVKKNAALIITKCCRGGGSFRLFGRSALDRALDLFLRGDQGQWQIFDY